MLAWIVVLVVIIALLIVLGLAVGAGSRAARRHGADQSSPPADVKVIERH
jgi:uncharacterized membrane protein